MRVPSEAPELSVQLGQRISAMEEVHIKLLHEYFEEKRDQVDAFIIREWVPEFAENVFDDPTIENIWEQVVQSGNKHDRLQFFVRMGPKLQAKINEQRLFMIAPLDELERTMEIKIRQEYLQAKAVNNSITSYLVSAVKVAQSRDKYLAKVGITNEKMDEAIDDVGEVVDFLTEKRSQGGEILDASEKYREKLKDILSYIKQ